ncbi:hypothetical protein FAZ15_11595 [Sphingobacterium olei]|uniref:Uncharacterized protein n=1 Tax=Sphingobacterium olei TaxID=2571155 RepID=A0A4U0P0F1_9SPHI|nr:hypothetical protein [Sphingobacterium olei]TJZ60629.1 hypothetical protein FAZ15_11595 [Sphingobacterium olei]
MNKNIVSKDTYAGMMYSLDFAYWYTYLKRRIAQGWSTEEVSFLLGRAPFYYTDFERMHNVGGILKEERILLDRVYQDSTTESMTFHREKYEVNEKRLVRVNIEDEGYYKDYKIIIPWVFASEESYMVNGKTKIRSCAAPKLTFREWKEEESLASVSDAIIDVREKLDRLLKSNYFKEGRAPDEIFQAVEFTGQYNLRIFPRHVKDGLYNLIKAGQMSVRNVDGRYMLFEI